MADQWQNAIGKGFGLAIDEVYNGLIGKGPQSAIRKGDTSKFSANDLWAATNVIPAGPVGKVLTPVVKAGVKTVAKAVAPSAAKSAANSLSKLIAQKQVAVNMPRTAFDKMMAMENPQYLTQLDGVQGMGLNNPAYRQQLAEQAYGKGANPISGFLTTKNPKPFVAGANDVANRVSQGATPNLGGGANVGAYGKDDLVTLYLNKNASKKASIFPGDAGALGGSAAPRPLAAGKVSSTDKFVQDYLQGGRGNYVEANVSSIKPSDIAKIAAQSPESVLASLNKAGLKIPVQAFKAAQKDPNKLQALITNAQKKAAVAINKAKVGKLAQPTQVSDFGALPTIEG